MHISACIGTIFCFQPCLLWIIVNERRTKLTKLVSTLIVTHTLNFFLKKPIVMKYVAKARAASIYHSCRWKQTDKYSFVSAIQHVIYDIKRNTWLLAYSFCDVTLRFETKASARNRAIVLSPDCPSPMTTAHFTVFPSFFFCVLESPLVWYSSLKEKTKTRSRAISSLLLLHLLIRRWLRTMNAEQRLSEARSYQRTVLWLHG